MFKKKPKYKIGDIVQYGDHTTKVESIRKYQTKAGDGGTVIVYYYRLSHAPLYEFGEGTIS